MVIAGKCPSCRRVTNELGDQTPRNWKPFGWGPSTETPRHFYVFPEDTPDSTPGIPQEVDTTKLCKVPNPERR